MPTEACGIASACRDVPPDLGRLSTRPVLEPSLPAPPAPPNNNEKAKSEPCICNVSKVADARSAFATAGGSLTSPEISCGNVTLGRTGAASGDVLPVDKEASEPNEVFALVNEQ
eukprot:CAMPEP_0115718622 /NCGR_PEP_ID=MMETSP0272-20121206/77527_1 /TAXON_ID=71861 /ORGANISM="Scrippsiella trochoidea, Strain CCMP3099" /LENGTH=113 /DNA_ID=CAMNT_0003161159 /DNA_START=416 /DNA_END=757 /DNA_ORIENTATION=+